MPEAALPEAREDQRRLWILIPDRSDWREREREGERGEGERGEGERGEGEGEGVRREGERKRTRER